MDDAPDILVVLGNSIAGSVNARPEPMPQRDPVMAGGVRLTRAASVQHDTCDGGRVAFGAGHMSGDVGFDWCSHCYVAEREHPVRQPTVDETAQFALAGIGRSGVPLHLELKGPDDLELLRALVAEFDGLLRVALLRMSEALISASDLGALDVVIVMPAHYCGRSESGDLPTLARYLHRVNEVPPIDPDLMHRVRAAADERGVVHDAELADEYFQALVRQNEEARRLRGWPEPVIEAGSVFPSAASGDVLPEYADGDPPEPTIPGPSPPSPSDGLSRA
ncbi:MAG: hypothetical protein JWM86_160 [Thermoleophilia bacterium]|nr:hypothetical protein [Thermoleophilia bacterium]